MERPQRVRRPPAWFSDFITGGDLDQSATVSQLSHTHLKAVNMAQQQLNSTPLELQDMWHLSDDEERAEKRLPGEGLDICWLAAETKRTVTDKFYEATAQEGKCTVSDCDYSTLSRRKLLEHLVTHYVVYVTDCQYTTSRRDSAVKHLRTCHNRSGSITQADVGSWSRLRELNPSLPTNCPSLPMNSGQYRAASRCSNERPVTVSSLPISVKRIRTRECPVADEPVVERQPVVVRRPEEPPVVRVEQRVALRRRLARLREDFQAVSRLKDHIETDMQELEQQLGKRKRY